MLFGGLGPEWDQTRSVKRSAPPADVLTLQWLCYILETRQNLRPEQVCKSRSERFNFFLHKASFPRPPLIITKSFSVFRAVQCLLLKSLPSLQHSFSTLTLFPIFSKSTASQSCLNPTPGTVAIATMDLTIAQSTPTAPTVGSKSTSTQRMKSPQAVPGRLPHIGMDIRPALANRLLLLLEYTARILTQAPLQGTGRCSRHRILHTPPIPTTRLHPIARIRRHRSL